MSYLENCLGASQNGTIYNLLSQPPEDLKMIRIHYSETKNSRPR